MPEDVPAETPRCTRQTLLPAIHFVKRHYNKKLRIEEVAAICGMSSGTFSRTFRSTFGMSFKEYIANHRIGEARRMLRRPRASITDVAYATGFSDHSYFDRVFKAHVGWKTVDAMKKFRGTYRAFEAVGQGDLDVLGEVIDEVIAPGYIEHVRQRGARRVELVPNGAETAMFDPAAGGEEFRQQHGLQGRFVVLYAGAHGMSNDLGVVLEAASRLRNQPEIAFVLLGDGKEKANLIALAQGMGLANVHFLPPLSKTEIPAALAAADTCLAILKPIELYKTTYPNKVFDYLAAGRPVVLAIDGVIRQVIEDAGAGIPVPPGDPAAMAAAILRLYLHPEQGRAMGLRARQYVETYFDRAQLADHLADLMKELIAQP